MIEMEKPSAESPPRKRIIVCCDGTWKDSDGGVQIPSNVTRISRAINPVGLNNSTVPPTHIPQVIFYQNGVGTGSNSLWSRYIGGATGEGISLNIREAYSFICLNYHEGDEIILIGFSRGAFTARSVASLIRAVGLLTPAGLHHLTPIFEDWKFQEKHGWTTRYPNEPWMNRGKLDTDDYRRKLLELEYTRPNIPIKCVAVWDTVGALGVPSIWLLPQNAPTDYQLVNTCVEPNIEYAFQALALDERRRPYYPTIWERPTGQQFPRVLKQTWFPGVHSDVGGSYDDADLANITLAWMITQLDPIISFNHEVITREIRMSKERHEQRGEAIREWGLGKIHNSMSLFFALFGERIRRPQEYHEVDPSTKRKRPRRLENTNEFMHSSVRIRMGRQGSGYDDKGIYDPPSLQGWVFEGTETRTDTPIAKSLPGQAGKMKNVKWKKEIACRNAKGGTEQIRLEMLEDSLEGYEKRILALWPELLKEFDSMRPGKHNCTIRRASTYPTDTPMLSQPSPHGAPNTPPVPPIPLNVLGSPKSPGRSGTA